jgi:hypothetical protein
LVCSLSDVGIWNIEHHPLGTSAPNVFHVQVADLTSGNVMLTVTSTPPAHWQQFKLGFLATVRRDVLVDTVHFGMMDRYCSNILPERQEYSALYQYCGSKRIIVHHSYLPEWLGTKFHLH